MFLPIGDAPNPQNFRPWVTWVLMGLNIAVYLLLTLPMSYQGVDAASPLAQEYLRHLTPQVGFPMSPEQLLAQVRAWDLFVFAHGYKPGAANLADLFSSMFMHAGLMHLAGNMLFLWIYGDNVEHRFGRVVFLLTYLGTGVIATLSFGAFAGPSMVPLVGASGAISGVLGCYFLLFPRNRVKVFVFLFPFIMTTIMVPARIVLGIFLVLDNLLPAFFHSSSGGGVAYGAHIGGFLGGLAAAFVLDRVGWPAAPGARRSARPSAKRPAAPRRPKGLTLAEAEGILHNAVKQGDRATALKQAHLLHPSIILQQLGPDTVTLAQWLAEADETILAMGLLRRALALDRGQVDQAKIFLALGLVRLRQGQPTAAYQHLLAVFDHDPDEATAARAKSALSQIAPS